MRLTLSLALLVALAGCDAAAPSPTYADAKKASSDGFLVTTLDANGQSSEHRQAKVDICHYDDETATYKRISVGSPALSTHLQRHPDAMLGGEVPSADVPSTLDNDCAVVPTQPFTCETVYGNDDRGHPNVTVIGRSTDATTYPTIVNESTDIEPDLSQDSIVEPARSSLLYNPGGYFALFQSYVATTDDTATLHVAVSSPSAGNSDFTFTCGPYPVQPPNPS